MVRSLTGGGTTVILTTHYMEEAEVLAVLTGWARARGVDLPGLTVERLTLEDVYLRLTGYGSAGRGEPR